MIELPVYEPKLPVTNKTIEFSPLVVKEEKNITYYQTAKTNTQYLLKLSART